MQPFGAVGVALHRWTLGGALLASFIGAAFVNLGFVSAAPPAEAPAAKLAPDHAAQMALGLDLFKTKIRGLLNENCVKCHGGKKTEGEFDLTTREGLLHGGSLGVVVVPGKSGDSMLLKLIRHEEEPAMPHKAPKLSDEAIALVAKWLDAGAPYDQPLIEKAGTAKGRATVSDADRQFWSFLPIKRVDPPMVKNERWTRTPIDRFVLAKLEAAGLTPNPGIDRRKLIRRASFDLLGLPPTPEEIEAFVNDPAPDAYEKLLDRLLASPRYGERWGRHWLDLARFAESHGYEQDYDRPSAYHYRDFVIRALNEDMPYNQFVQWQIAGDELEPNNPQAMMATGFLGAGTHATQITANQVEKERYDELDDMTATIGTSMLGMTIGCARCHDHKFDPIPQQDYYRMLSTFTTTVRSEIELDLQPELYLKKKEEYERQRAPLAQALEAFEKNVLPGRVEKWLATNPMPPEARWLVLDPVEFKSAGGAVLTKQDDGSFLASGANPASDTYTFVAHTSLKNITALRLEALSHPSFVKHGPGRAANGNFALSDFRMTIAPLDGKAAGEGKEKPVAVKLVNPKASFEQAGLPIAASLDDNKTSSWAVDPQFGKDHAAVFELETPGGFDGGTVITLVLKFENNTSHSIGRPRIAISTAAKPVALDGEQAAHKFVVEIGQILAAPAEQRTEAQKAALFAWYRTTDADWRKLNQPLQEHLKQTPKPALTKVMVTSEGLPAIRLHTQGADFFDKTFFLKRGDLNQKQGEAPQGFLQALMPGADQEKRWQVPPPSGWRTSYRRLSLANWITDVESGAGDLLARVIVNRLWQHHLGRGIVATPSDFGVQGERPTHPELLDWLAGELIHQGWRLKPMHRLLMTSAVYLQGTESDPERTRIDPGNSLFWRRSLRRLEGEAIRDAMLSISGTLDETMYGPGSLDEGQRRRSIYFTIKRSQLVPIMILFDGPDSLQSQGHRASTTIAPQALALLNNPHVQNYARGFAKRLLPKAGESPAAAIRAGYQIALGRLPADDELADSLAFVQQQTESYKAARKPDAFEMALASFCQALMGLNEFVYVE